MSKNRLPPNHDGNTHHQHFDNVELFADRLIGLQEALTIQSNNVAQVEPDLSPHEQERIEEEYKLLPSPDFWRTPRNGWMQKYLKRVQSCAKIPRFLRC